MEERARAAEEEAALCRETAAAVVAGVKSKARETQHNISAVQVLVIAIAIVRQDLM